MEHTQIRAVMVLLYEIQGPRSLLVRDDVELMTALPKPLVPHLSPSTKAPATRFARYGAVCYQLLSESQQCFKKKSHSLRRSCRGQSREANRHESGTPQDGIRIPEDSTHCMIFGEVLISHSRAEIVLELRAIVAMRDVVDTSRRPTQDLCSIPKRSGTSARATHSLMETVRHTKDSMRSDLESM